MSVATAAPVEFTTRKPLHGSAGSARTTTYAQAVVPVPAVQGRDALKKTLETRQMFGRHNRFSRPPSQIPATPRPLESLTRPIQLKEGQKETSCARRRTSSTLRTQVYPKSSFSSPELPQSGYPPTVTPAGNQVLSSEVLPSVNSSGINTTRGDTRGVDTPKPPLPDPRRPGTRATRRSRQSA
jgi:hypothetical protein